MEFKLDERVNCVNVQFSFTSPRLLEKINYLDSILSEDVKLSQERKAVQNGGVQLLAPTMNMGISSLLDDLHKAGYEIESALWQKRHNYHKSTKDNYFMVRFVFLKRQEKAGNGSEELWRQSVLSAFDELATESMWRARAYRNPQEEGAMLSLNFEVRVPLYRPDGRPEMRWRKDAEGNKLGDAPYRLRPDDEIRLVG